MDETVAARDPEAAFVETAVGARRIAAAAADAGVPRLVYVSTVHVYGAAAVEGAVLTEDVVPPPRDAYADACRLLAACTAPDRVPAGTYNLGSGQPTTTREVAGLVVDAFEELTGRRPPLEAPGAPDDAPKPHSSTSAAWRHWASELPATCAPR
jgi:nucleoside-diphosphate-sugar epimerase